MQGGRPQHQQGLAVHSRAVAGMALEAKTGMSDSQASDQGIAGLLGKHAGCCNRQAEAVAPDDGALGTAPAPQWQNAIDQQQIKGRRTLQLEPLQSALHRPFGGGADAMAINLARGGLPERPGLGRCLNLRYELGATARRESLAVGQAGSGQWHLSSRRQDHGAGEHRAEPAATSHLIHSGHDAGAESGQRRLDGG